MPDYRNKRLVELKRVLRYLPKTGVFRWRIRLHGHGGKIRPGDEAGTSTSGRMVISYTFDDGYKGVYLAHRLAYWFMTGKKPPSKADGEIGHEDGDPSNNKWKNLDKVTRSKNMSNPNDALRTDNISGYRGVSRIRREQGGGWHVRIQIDGKIHPLGNFDRKEDAIAARKAAEAGDLRPSPARRSEIGAAGLSKRKRHLNAS